MRPARQADPFAQLGLPARPGLTDDDVRSAWRRVATATHPDRADGGDAARFAAAAAAYTALRTPFDRAEALADLGRPPAGRRGQAAGAGRRAGRPAADGEKRRWRPAAGPVTRRWWLRVRHGRPVRLALRAVAAAAVSLGAVLVAGPRPATFALITGALTWLALTARHNLAPPG